MNQNKSNKFARGIRTLSKFWGAEIREKRVRCAHLEADNDYLLKRISDLQMELEKAEKENQRLRSERKEMIQQLKTTKDEYADVVSINNMLNDNISQLTNNNTSLINQLATRTTEYYEARDEVTELEGKLQARNREPVFKGTLSMGDGLSGFLSGSQTSNIETKGEQYSLSA